MPPSSRSRPILLRLPLRDGGHPLGRSCGRGGAAPGFVEAHDPRAGGGPLALLARRGVVLAGPRTAADRAKQPLRVFMLCPAPPRGPPRELSLWWLAHPRERAPR